MIRKLLTTALCCASLVSLGCASAHLPGVYKVDVPQGNIVTQDMVNQLHTGMNKRQVAYAMGTPMVVDVFHPDRWDYIYSFKPGNGKREEHHVTLFFTNDELTRIEGDYQPQPAARNKDAPKETSVTVTPPPQKKHWYSWLFGKNNPDTESDSDSDSDTPPNANPPPNAPRQPYP